MSIKESFIFQEVLKGYLAAVSFCAEDKALSPEVKEKAAEHIEQFFLELLGNVISGDLPPLNIEDVTQVGHDLYLTGAGHGSGFWDKPEIYGENAETLTSFVSVKKFAFEIYEGDDGLLHAL